MLALRVEIVNCCCKTRMSDGCDVRWFQSLRLAPRTMESDVHLHPQVTLRLSCVHVVFHVGLSLSGS